MNQLTYKEAYDLIIDAYFKDKIKPCEANFCFCGTLTGNGDWYWARRDKTYNEMGYNGEEFYNMEKALFEGMSEISGLICFSYQKGYEDVLFNGMSKALDVLKQIHISRGEIIDEPVTFKKRELSMQ